MYTKCQGLKLYSVGTGRFWKIFMNHDYQDPSVAESNFTKVLATSQCLGWEGEVPKSFQLLYTSYFISHNAQSQLTTQHMHTTNVKQLKLQEMQGTEHNGCKISLSLSYITIRGKGTMESAREKQIAMCAIIWWLSLHPQVC